MSVVQYQNKFDLYIFSNILIVYDGRASPILISWSSMEIEIQKSVFISLHLKMKDSVAMLHANKYDPVKKGSLVMLNRNDISEANPLRKWEWM